VPARGLLPIVAADYELLDLIELNPVHCGHFLRHHHCERGIGAATMQDDLRPMTPDIPGYSDLVRESMPEAIGSHPAPRASASLRVVLLVENIEIGGTRTPRQRAAAAWLAYARPSVVTWLEPNVIIGSPRFNQRGFSTRPRPAHFGLGRLGNRSVFRNLARRPQSGRST
jgi:hypothetical protein